MPGTSASRTSIGTCPQANAAAPVPVGSGSLAKSSYKPGGIPDTSKDAIPDTRGTVPNVRTPMSSGTSKPRLTNISTALGSAAAPVGNVAEVGAGTELATLP